MLNGIAKEMISHFFNSYIEFSPSGKGLRIFTFLSESIAYNNDLYKMEATEVEFYVAGFTNRFVTVAGSIYQGEMVEENKELFCY